MLKRVSRYTAKNTSVEDMFSNSPECNIVRPLLQMRLWYVGASQIMGRDCGGVTLSMAREKISTAVEF